MREFTKESFISLKNIDEAIMNGQLLNPDLKPQAPLSIYCHNKPRLITLLSVT